MVWFGVLGAPRFSVQGSPNSLVQKVIGSVSLVVSLTIEYEIVVQIRLSP